MSSIITIPTTMRAVLVRTPGATNQMYISDTVPVPSKLAADEILIKVHCFGINRAETLQRKGLYNPPVDHSPILGLEVSGEIVLIGSTDNNVSEFKLGSRVCALVNGGGYAEYCIANIGSTLSIPDNMSYSTAAGICECYFTAYQGLRLIGSITATDSILIHAGASGVGTAAIQISKLFQCQSIITTVSNSVKQDYCHSLGSTNSINRLTNPNWVNTIKQSNPAGINLIFDCVAGNQYSAQNLSILATDSKWILYGLMGGAVVDQFPLSTILLKRISLIGTTLRNRSQEYKTKLVQRFKQEIYPSIINGTIKLMIDKIFPFNQIIEAHNYMEADKTMGKIIVQIIE